MKERDLYTQLMKDLNCPAAIKALGIGGNVGRFVKPRDGWGVGKDGKMVRIPNPIDCLWTTDCLELKMIKARTTKGMVFRAVKHCGEKQLEELEKHNALIAIAFVLETPGATDRRVLTCVMRFWRIQRSLDGIETNWSMAAIEAMSEYTIKGQAYGKVPTGPTRRQQVEKPKDPVAEYLES